jgi:hypothetical protein
MMKQGSMFDIDVTGRWIHDMFQQDFGAVRTEMCYRIEHHHVALDIWIADGKLFHVHLGAAGDYRGWATALNRFIEETPYFSSIIEQREREIHRLVVR